MRNIAKAGASLLGLLLLLASVSAIAAENKSGPDKSGLSATLKACYADCKDKKPNEAYEACMIACKKAEPKRGDAKGR